MVAASVRTNVHRSRRVFTTVTLRMSVDHDSITTSVHVLVSSEDSVMDTGTVDSV
jgi:hypothetical protein